MPGHQVLGSIWTFAECSLFRQVSVITVTVSLRRGGW